MWNLQFCENNGFAKIERVFKKWSGGGSGNGSGSGSGNDGFA